MPILKKEERIITTPRDIGEGLVGVRSEGESIICTHREDITAVLEDAYLSREHSDDGWSKGRGFRRIGTIPASVFFSHPEFAEGDLETQRKAIVKFLKSSDGAAYRTTQKGI